MASAPTTRSWQEPPAPLMPPPPLENGDHLTREEFERRYEAMPNIKAELLEGVVYMASPVNHKKHGRPHSKVTAWLAFYAVGTPGVDFGSDSSLKLDRKNEPQPDALLYILPSHGGQAQFDDVGYFTSSPD